ncbi:flagellar hook capping protein [Desulfotomaculum nigrificans CO-1-SRB]|uniref:Flagellar hook capping protein n=1 Tax=Desulfotomaculum nigrificans (strain DSM 14880 / VKM B-2319 / CO-1-SRB) TaxID=868595 RepID=F6B802_DESCC|nr:flagellar hook capping FlgD N-terminal domain-containing protein [Desulfotomaculum nigrificans]AEF94639.1 flagellar hook capping protein [Desulfotomaculum nigrificans CO-1-SRB]
MAVNSVNNDLFYDNNKSPRKPVKTLDKDAFLQIMVAQLKYQDPTSPMDNDKMIEQIAQFTTLEQITNLNSNFEKLYSLQQLGYGSSLIGYGVTLQNGDENISGTVQKVTMDATGVKIWVADKPYDLSQITSVEKGSVW